jgi:hypothetical protein
MDSSLKVIRSAKKHVSDLFSYVAESLDQEKNEVVEAREIEKKVHTEVELIYKYQLNIDGDGLEYHTGICIFGTEYYYCSNGIQRRKKNITGTHLNHLGHLDIGKEMFESHIDALSLQGFG